MVHRGFKREDPVEDSKKMAPFNLDKREVVDTLEFRDEVSKRMGQLLLRGFTMLDAICPCGGILMEDRSSGRRCVACELRDEEESSNPPEREPLITSTTTNTVSNPIDQSPSIASNSSSTVYEEDLREYVSKGMGRMLLKGYTMLDANCTCTCILMADRDGNRTCLACEYRKSHNTVVSQDNSRKSDYGFEIKEIPLNTDLPSSSKFSNDDVEELEDTECDKFRDEVTKRMGELLLKGVTMLDSYCKCGAIMMQERNGTKRCIECEIRNEGSTEVVAETEKIDVENKNVERKQKRKVSFQSNPPHFHSHPHHNFKKVHSSEWKTVTEMTIQSKLVWLSHKLEQTQDYDEMSKILLLIEHASRVVQNL